MTARIKTDDYLDNSLYFLMKDNHGNIPTCLIPYYYKEKIQPLFSCHQYSFGIMREKTSEDDDEEDALTLDHFF